MNNNLSDDNGNRISRSTGQKARTTDLIISEHIILIGSFIALAALYIQYGILAIWEGIQLMITPLLYTIRWRRKSTKFEWSTQTITLQSGEMLILALLGILQSFCLVLMALGECNLIGAITIIYGVTCLFYIIKTFWVSYTIDCQ